MWVILFKFFTNAVNLRDTYVSGGVCVCELIAGKYGIFVVCLLFYFIIIKLLILNKNNNNGNNMFVT